MNNDLIAITKAEYKHLKKVEHKYDKLILFK